MLGVCCRATKYVQPTHCVYSRSSPYTLYTLYTLYSFCSFCSLYGAGLGADLGAGRIRHGAGF
jgi:hypothetical protein